MNEIAKQRIMDRVIEALEKELLSKNMAGPMIGIHPSYLSCVVVPEKLNKCPDAAWEVLQKWVNSGLSITKYAEKNGVLVKKKPEKIVPKTQETIPEPLKTGMNLHDLATYPRKEMPIEEKKPHPRLSNGQMVDLLLEEKQRLSIQIEAIDVLLKHYIS